MAALAVWTPVDGVLGAVAPLALAAAAGTALVIDLDPAGPNYPGSGSIAGLIRTEPSRAHLQPERSGLAVTRLGGVSIEAAVPVVDALIEHWPAVVLRLPAAGPAPGEAEPQPFAPVVPVRPLLDADVFPWNGRPAVYQRMGRRSQAAGPGIVLPKPLASTWRALLAGTLPRRGRWLRAWRPVWEAGWA